ncbi:hypothetical protein M422DRAFT_270320 [Sphaerobolus stellatus SS14]|uniref:Uncharacterized protein n=1 Tax=Sphaerobolus stellatus (strain SS14) TaxID=990650 RepID=A0A0C9UT88_SPHS4|nr:hypothetical protein M422DRAFT_270320 [Sphaerobolus stellatus SS14]
MGNATRQVHAVFGPVQGGINDVKNGSSSFEHAGPINSTTYIPPQPYAYSLAVAWRQLFRRSSIHHHSDTQGATHPFLYRSDDLHDALCHCRFPKSINDGSYPASLRPCINSLIPPRLQLLHIDLITAAP